MVDSIKAGTLVVPPTVEQPKPARQIADTPVREKADVVRSAEDPPDRGEIVSVERLDERKLPLRPSALPEARNAAVATYRDSESGRLIVRIFDKDSGDILVEFPPEDPPFDSAASRASQPAGSKTNIDV